MSARTFPPDLIEAAQASRARWGCPASVCLAQWALESNWGASMSGKNNPFGIKARAGDPSTPRMTWEVVNGHHVQMVQNFRDYASISEAFDDHGRLLATGSAYAPARAVKNDAHAYANALTGHYATDPSYGSKLIGIMSSYDLFKYDVGQAGTPLGVPSQIAPKAPAKPKGAKVATGAVVVASTAGAVAAPHGSILMAALVAVAMIGAGVFIVLHNRK